MSVAAPPPLRARVVVLLSPKGEVRAMLGVRHRVSWSYGSLLLPSALDRGLRSATGDRRLRGVPGARHAMGSPAHVPDLRAHRLLRQLGGQARHGAPLGDRPPR